MHNTHYGFKPELVHVGSPGIVKKKYTRTPGIVPVLQKATEVRGKGMAILQNLQKGSDTELTEVPGIFARAHITHIRKKKMIYPYPGYLWHWRAELPEVPGTGINVQNFQKFRVRV